MSYERWLRIGTAASVLLLILAAGALAAQWRSSQDAARLRAQLAQMQRQQQRQPNPSQPTRPEASAPVAVTRVRVVPDQVSGPFAVQVTVTNRSRRTLSQPVHALLIVSDPENPQKEAHIQRRQAIIESFSPGDTTTVVLKGFEPADPELRHEVVVSTPALDPDRTAATVMKVIPQVVAPPRKEAQAEQRSEAPKAPAPARQQPPAAQAPSQAPSQPQPAPPTSPTPPAQGTPGQGETPAPGPTQPDGKATDKQQPGTTPPSQQQPTPQQPAPQQPAPQQPAPEKPKAEEPKGDRPSDTND